MNHFLDASGLTYLWGKIKTAVGQKQDLLVSGVNIKTINGNSILGNGNIFIEGGSGEPNVIEAITFNGSEVPVTDKVAAITAVIPDAVTEATVAGWGFTKNTGTYSKPSGGIPKTDLASDVQTSLGLANTALQSFTESDPIFTASVAYGITSSDITNWNSKTSNVGTITGVSMNGTSIATSGVANITSVPASILTGAIPSAVTAATQALNDNSTKIATTAYVDASIAALPEPMIFKGSLGTGGTITSLPTAAVSNTGFTYKVITDGTYDSQSAKIGDTFISDGTAWILIPSGDEPSGTVTSITIKANSPISIDNSAAITTSGTRTISHNTSGVTAGTYAKVTVDTYGHVTAGASLAASDIPNLSWSKITSDKPTTLSGYGITDAKISNGTITLGSNSITPLTSHQSLAGYLPLSGGTMTGSITFPNASAAYSSAGVKWAGGSTIGEDMSGSLGIYGSGNVFIRTNTANSTYTYGIVMSSTSLKYNDNEVLTTGNAYVTSGKGYINGTEITTITGNAATATKASQDEDGTAFKGYYLRKVSVPNNTENDFNTFENMTLTGRGDPTTGASLSHAPWTNSGPAGGYGVLTYLWSTYGIQMAWGYSTNHIYIRNKYYDVSSPVWSDLWSTIALTSDNVASATKLQTARTIWGQSFDGTGNVSGALSDVTNITMSGNLSNTRTTSANTAIGAANTNGAVELLASSNRGVYVSTTGNWLVGTDGTNTWLSIGNVGIGTTSPATKLDVNGAVEATNFSANGTDVAPFYSSTTTLCTNVNADLLDGYHASSFPRITTGTLAANGKIRITFSQTFSAIVTIRGAGGSQQLVLIGTGYGVNAVRNSWQQLSKASSTIKWSVPESDSISMSIEIENSSSTAANEVRVVQFTGGTCTITSISAMTTTGVNNPLVDTNSTQNITGIKTFANKVGIGTASPSYTLEVNGTAKLLNLAAEHDNELNCYYNNGDGNFQINFRVAGNVTLCNGGGNVGIGTTSPSYKLDVNGSLRATSIVKLDGTASQILMADGTTTDKGWYMKRGSVYTSSSTGTHYMKVGTYTQTSTGTTDMAAIFLVSSYYNRGNGILMVAYRRSSATATTPDSTYTHIKWLVKDGNIDMNSFIMTWKISGNTSTVNLYVKHTGAWQGHRFTMLDEGGWFQKTDLWTLYNVGVVSGDTSIPSDETQIVSTSA